MLCKLALRNVRRSFRDYGVYLLTLTFGVCLFYVFNSLEGQGAMVYLAQTGNGAVETILMLMNIFSVFVAVVLACLILYANRFLLRRRRRELGTYLLLGMEQGQVSRLLFLETGLVGLISLAVGLALGVAASYGLSALTLSMFALDLSRLLALSFSWGAAGKTVLYFGLIFLLVMLFSGVQVCRAKLIDLMQGARRNEELHRQRTAVSAVQLAAGVVLLLAAYAILLIFGMTVVACLPLCIPMLVMGSLGTLLIFRSLSGFVLRWTQAHPKQYFKGLNMFTLRQWLSRVHSTYLAQTVICLLLLLAIGVTASSLGLNSTITAQSYTAQPLHATVQDRGEGTQAPGAIARRLAEAGFDSDAEMALWRDFLLWFWDGGEEFGERCTALAAADYNALRAIHGLPPREIAGPEWYDQGENLCSAFRSLGDVVILPDGMTQGLELRREVWTGNYAGDMEQTEARLRAAVEVLYQQPGDYCVATYLAEYGDMMGSKMLALFLGLYLGVTFFLAAAAVLALQQLSQAADNTGRYAALRRLGAEPRQMGASATGQVALAFLLPLGLALAHSAVGMRAANDLIASMGRVDSVQSSLVTALILLLVYGGYFAATALACRRMALRAGEK